ncbi:hypothetical protein PYJP_16590 [Pyrofollis japonicus]|uniref:SAM-dependent methyltransferase n=1 Tax=Pyrofollis japonicus TaxID=3060460 RepID=UPI00295B9D3B|nr:methyltransferase domain-containing protein [Pyrofollis japonicus]BEP18307.1 hypothetical protein PYJP_16590 [Pyrofollis japonicus]
MWQRGGKVAPWIPTPLSIVYAALEAAWASPCDTVYDLGAGDGRAVIIAAREFCVRRAVGVEIDPVLVEAARAKAHMDGVEDRVEIIEQDFFKTSLQGATLVYMYLYRSINEALRSKLEEELRPGARVVTIDFPVPGWVPVYTPRLRDENDILRTIHVYVIGLSDTRYARRGEQIREWTRELQALAGCNEPPPPGCRPRVRRTQA